MYHSVTQRKTCSSIRFPGFCRNPQILRFFFQYWWGASNLHGSRVALHIRQLARAARSSSRAFPMNHWNADEECAAEEYYPPPMRAPPTGNSHDCTKLYPGLRPDHLSTGTARAADAVVAAVAAPDKVRSVKKVKVHPAGLTTLGSGVCRSVVAAGSRYLLQGRPGTRRAQAPGGTI